MRVAAASCHGQGGRATRMCRRTRVRSTMARSTMARSTMARSTMAGAEVVPTRGPERGSARTGPERGTARCRGASAAAQE
eukprot:3686146-Prymnesium_polylepis.1